MHEIEIVVDPGPARRLRLSSPEAEWTQQVSTEINYENTELNASDNHLHSSYLRATDALTRQIDSRET